MRPAYKILAAASAILLSVPAFAQDYPQKAITIVVPNAAGSITDTVSRLIGQKLSERLKQTVLIENRAGANTQIAAEYVAKAAPDGYTLLMTTNTSHSANPSLYKKLRYDPVSDFTPIVRTGKVPFVLLVNPKVPAKDFKEFLAYAKANPAKISYANPVSSSLISSEAIRVKAGIDIVGVPYTSSPKALTDLLGGQLEMFVADIATARTAIDSGKVRALAVTTGVRSNLLPDVPAAAETLPGIDVISWAGLFGPAKLPDQIRDRLATEVVAILSENEMRERLEKIGFEVHLTKSPDEFATFVADQLTVWAGLVKQAGIEPQ